MMKRIIYLLVTVLCFFSFCYCSNDNKNIIDPLEEEIACDISVMSFNIRYANTTDGENNWYNRKTGCLKMINSVKPSLIGMQEVRPTQKTYFNETLTGYNHIGIPRDNSGTGSEAMMIYYRKDLFTLVDSSTFWLSATPDVMSKGWDGACYRTCTWTKLRVNNSGKEVFFFNTHVDHKGAEAQKQGTLLLKAKIKEIAGDNAPVFMTGDFNMTPDNENIIDFSDYMNSTRDQFVDGDYYSTGTFNNWGESGSIIDYVWYRNASPVNYRVINGTYADVAYLSDHYPIIGYFDFSK